MDVALGDALLDEALTTVSEKEGKRPQNVVPRLGKGVHARLYELLVGAGVLRRRSGSPGGS